jgi:hypothetical protein
MLGPVGSPYHGRDQIFCSRSSSDDTADVLPRLPPSVLHLHSPHTTNILQMYIRIITSLLMLSFFTFLQTYWSHSLTVIGHNCREWNSGVPRNFFFGGVSTNSVEDRGQRERGSGGSSPLVRGSTQFANE